MNECVLVSKYRFKPILETQTLIQRGIHAVDFNTKIILSDIFILMAHYFYLIFDRHSNRIVNGITHSTFSARLKFILGLIQLIQNQFECHLWQQLHAILEIKCSKHFQMMN